MSTFSQTNKRYRFVERGHGDITADVVNDQELGTILWVQTSVDGCYVKPERIGEFAAGMRAVAAAQPADSDRLSPQREAEIREHLASTENFSLGNLAARDLLAELAAVRAELARRTEDVAFLERNTLPELRREVEHHQGGKQRWRDRAEKAEERLSAVLDLCDREQRKAMGWENPVPVPDWVAVVQRAALGDDTRTEAAS